jgi:hypothetical protein
VKIGIIGLLSSQVATIKAAFPELKIEFLSREREREAGRFAGNCSKVVLMTKFISHSVFGSIPTHKRVPVKGGMTDLRRTLQTLSEMPEFARRAPVATKEVTMSTALYWNGLREAKVGDVVTFTRPTSMSTPEWKQHVANRRSYYKRQYGIHTVANVTGNKAEVEVVNIESVVPETAPVEKADAAGQIALLWANFVIHRCANGTPLETAMMGADDFIAAFKGKFL